MAYKENSQIPKGNRTELISIGSIPLWYLTFEDKLGKWCSTEAGWDAGGKLGT